MSSHENGPAIPSANEETPLLRDHNDPPKDLVAGNESSANTSTTATTAEQTIIPDPPSKRKLIVTLGTIYFGVFLGALDSTIIATLSALISTSFNSLRLLSWLASAYLIANSACQPLSGRLTDIFSRRTGLVVSNILFAAGNLICGLAKNEGVMITGRAVAGMGGGGLMAISTFVASDLVPLRRRGLIQGFGNICYGLGAGLGGLFGGWVNDVWGWRFAFLAQVPPVILSGILVYFLVDVPAKKSERSRLSRVDFLGSGSLVTALVLLLLGLNSGGNTVPWTHPLVLSCLPLSLVGLAAFAYIELYIATEPVIPLRLLANRTVLSAGLTNWFMTMVNFAVLFYVPIFFQVKGYSAFEAGKRLIPGAVGASIGSLGSGGIMNHTGRYKILVVSANLMVMLGAGLLCTISFGRIDWPVFVFMFIFGLGQGAMLTTTLLATISAVPHRHQAVITSATYFFRSTGSTIGITLASALFQNVLRSSLFSHFPPSRYPASPDIIGRITDSLDELQHLPAGWKGGVLESYMTALRGVFVLSLGLATLGVIVSLGVREFVLHKTLDRNEAGDEED